MSPRKPPPQPPGPDEDESQLWQAATKDVHKLADDGKAAPHGTPKRIRTARPAAPQALSVSGNGPAQGKGLDGRTAQRLAQGKLPIDARLDLHGRTLAEAHGAVRAFILQEYARGSRCVLVITGKGEREAAGPWYESPRGGIRRHLRGWLADADLANLTLALTPARPNHGGEGAFYILLRRQRPISE